MKDYYKILGISKNASQEEIKEAFRRLAHKHHPDKSGGDEKKFKEANEAYQILSNKEKRAQFDRFGQVFSAGGGPAYGREGFDWQGQNPFGDFGFNFNFGQEGVNFEGGDLSDIFEAFFEGLGVKKKRRTYQRGADLEISQEITLEETFKGASKKINFETFVICGKCRGAGYFEKDGLSKCLNCDGRGEIKETKRGFFGTFAQIKTCPKCFGAGQIPNKICDLCAGKGRTKETKTVEVFIAPGTSDNQLIKVSGGGEAGERGTGAGDLYVKIRIKPHYIFSRENNDLMIKKELKLVDVLLGKKIEIPTIEGNKIHIEIPENFNLRDKFKISGEGMPKLGGYGRGDLYVEFQIKTPKKLNPKIKKLLEDHKEYLD